MFVDSLIGNMTKALVKDRVSSESHIRLETSTVLAEYLDDFRILDFDNRKVKSAKALTREASNPVQNLAG